MNYNEFKTKYLWKRVDYDKKYWYQCIDLIQQYIKEVWWLTPNSFWWSAINWWTNNTTFPSSQYIKIPNTKTTIPLPGDIIIFDKTSSNIHWHIALTNNATIKELTVLEQNWWLWSGTWIKEDAIRLHTYNYILPKVLWFIRKK